MIQLKSAEMMPCWLQSQPFLLSAALLTASLSGRYRVLGDFKPASCAALLYCHSFPQDDQRCPGIDLSPQLSSLCGQKKCHASDGELTLICMLTNGMNELHDVKLESPKA